MAHPVIVSPTLIPWLNRWIESRYRIGPVCAHIPYVIQNKVTPFFSFRLLTVSHTQQYCHKIGKRVKIFSETHKFNIGKIKWPACYLSDKPLILPSPSSTHLKYFFFFLQVISIVYPHQDVYLPFYIIC